MKRLLAVLLMSILLTGILAGCGGSNKDESNQPSASENSNTDNTNNAGSDEPQDVNTSGKSYIDYDEDPYEVVIECLNLGTNMDSVPAIEEAVNAITVPAINVKVKLQVIHIADHATKTALWAAGGEKIDILYTGTTVPFSQFVSDGMIIPITDYLEERGTTILEKNGDLLESFKVNGEIYAIPQNLYCAYALGYNYNADMVKELGLDLPEVWDMAAITELGHQLKAADESKYLIAKNGSTDAREVSYFYGFEDFGMTTFAYGVLEDIYNGTELTNIYKSDTFREYCLYNIEWKENGFMPADQAVNGENTQDIFKNQMSLLTWVGTNPMEAQGTQSSTSFDCQQALTTLPTYSSTGVQEKSWGISINSERPDKAMDFLNYLFENAEVANLLNYGIDGQDYVFVDGSEKIITYPDGIDGGNVGWSRSFCLFGDDMENYQFAPATEAYYDEMKAFNDEAVITSTLGYTFDASSVSNSIAAVTNVVQEYVPSLVYGEIPEAELDDYINELNDKLDSAGIQEIIDENQNQLNAWLAAK